jgi:hypothetical protein
MERPRSEQGRRGAEVTSEESERVAIKMHFI